VLAPHRCCSSLAFKFPDMSAAVLGEMVLVVSRPLPADLRAVLLRVRAAFLRDDVGRRSDRGS
jgi:hypothetical protein